MSTAFFVEWPGVVDEGQFTPALSLHVCQSARTWHGIVDKYELEEARAVEPLTSVKAWWAYLEKAIAEGAVLHDEYGTVQTVEYLRDWADKVPGEIRRRGHQWDLDHAGQIGARPDKSWWDAEGFSFLDGWFR